METSEKNVFVDFVIHHPGLDALFGLAVAVVGGVLWARSRTKSFNTLFGSQNPAEFMREDR